jgi:transposase-like protein
VSESSQSPESSPALSESSSGRKPVRGRGAARDQVSESSGSSGRKPRRRLAPSEKYEVFVQVLTQQATQREAAERWQVDRSTVIGICRTAKQGALDALAGVVPGRPGRTAEQIELQAARAEIERLRATVTEQAVVLHLHQGKASWA